MYVLQASPLPMREDSVAGTIKTLLTKVQHLALSYILSFIVFCGAPPHHLTSLTISPCQLEATTSNSSLCRLLLLQLANVQANKEEIYDALLLQKVDIVLTAHPTEVNRRTLLRKYKEVSESLAKLDKKDMSPYEKSECEEALRREIYSIWGSDEIRREKPTPQTEAKGSHFNIVSLTVNIDPFF